MATKPHKGAPLWPFAIFGLMLFLLFVGPMIPDVVAYKVVLPALLILGAFGKAYLKKLKRSPLPGSKEHQVFLQARVRRALNDGR